MATQVQQLGVYSELPLYMRERLTKHRWNRGNIPSFNEQNDQTRTTDHPLVNFPTFGLGGTAVWLHKANPESPTILRVIKVTKDVFSADGDLANIRHAYIHEIFSFYCLNDKLQNAEYSKNTWHDQDIHERQLPTQIRGERDAIRLFLAIFPDSKCCVIL